MILKIEKDHQRFRQIVKGRIRDDLRKFLTKGELIGKEGKHLISIPVRGIDLPHAGGERYFEIPGHAVQPELADLL